MKLIIILCAVVFICFFSSCKNDTTSPPPASLEFSVKITVKNQSGAPVAGLRISAYNRLSNMFPQKTKNIKGDQSFPLSTTSIRYDIATESKIFLSVFDMDNKLVTTLVNGERQHSGNYTVNFNIIAPLPTRVYKYRLIAQDTTGGTEFFRDSLYAVMSTGPDIQQCTLGWTSQSGIYETKDSLFFPNVLKLPVLVSTDEFGNYLGNFTIRDTVVFYLTDTVTGKGQEFRRVVTNTANDIQLVWNPTLSKQLIPYSLPKVDRQSVIQTNPKTSVILGWKLYQNYPNPYN
jgi:hypothetical protein